MHHRAESYSPHRSKGAGPDVATALPVAEVLWPEFVEEGGATFVKSQRSIARQSIDVLGGPLESEISGSLPRHGRATAFLISSMADC